MGLINLISQCSTFWVWEMEDWAMARPMSLTLFHLSHSSLRTNSRGRRRKHENRSWMEGLRRMRCPESSFSSIISSTCHTFILIPLVVVWGSLDLDEVWVWWEEYFRWPVGSAVGRMKGEDENSQEYQGSEGWIPCLNFSVQRIISEWGALGYLTFPFVPKADCSIWGR